MPYRVMMFHLFGHRRTGRCKSSLHQTFFLASLCVLFACGEPPTSRELERQALRSFVKFDKAKFVTPAYVENTLYDVQSPTDTMGRAFRITKYLFLTNHHVIAPLLTSKKYAQLVKQENRGRLVDRKGEFTIVYHDKAKDIALLRIKELKKKSVREPDKSFWKKLKEKTQQIFQSTSSAKEIPEDKVYYHLYYRILKGKEAVTEFLRFDGKDTKHRGYHLEFGGFDLYEKSKYINKLGEFILPPNSALFEKKGYVLSFRKKEIAKITKHLPSLPENEMVTSIPVYQGESGSPVFLEAKKNQYYLAGITTKTLFAGDTIATPEHPLGVLAYERTISFIVHREAIVKFIGEYLKKMENVAKSERSS